MIFTLGFVLFLIALLSVANRSTSSEPPLWEAAAGCGGVLLMVISLCIMMWRTFP